jgi:hypothetical protein
MSAVSLPSVPRIWGTKPTLLTLRIQEFNHQYSWKKFSNHSREFRTIVSCHEIATRRVANSDNSQTKREE